MTVNEIGAIGFGFAVADHFNNVAANLPTNFLNSILRAPMTFASYITMIKKNDS